MKKNSIPHIPYDIYESPQEIVIVMPLWWVKKTSLKISLKDYKLIISWQRSPYTLKKNLLPLKQECYRGPVQQIIDLPAHVYFDKIHSTLSIDNILEIVVPKALIPEQISLEVAYE